MIKNLLPKILLVFLVMGSFSTLHAQKSKKKKKKTDVPAPKPKPKKDAILPYSKVITKKAKTDKGLFDVHTVDDKRFYEIPDSLLNKEMLMVTRISKTASGIGFGGGKINTQVLRWEKGKKDFLACRIT